VPSTARRRSSASSRAPTRRGEAKPARGPSSCEDCA
jgi:hypothetical protein